MMPPPHDPPRQHGHDRTSVVASDRPLLPDRWRCVERSLMDYADARRLQQRLVTARQTGRLETDMLLLLEHAPVFTLGHRGESANLKVTTSVLASRGIPLYRIERGGDITYHGPGQLVGYPIVDLKRARMGVVDFVERMETVMIRTAAAWGIDAGRNAANRGVWVGSHKLGSIGIAVRRGVSFHGFALNVNVDLGPFGWINPCGLKGIGITSMQRELGRALDMKAVRREIRNQMETRFDMRLEDGEPSDIISADRLINTEK